MRIKISLQARLELQAEVRQTYQKACWKKKREILDAFIATTGYQRKYAGMDLSRPIKFNYENYC